MAKYGPSKNQIRTLGLTSGQIRHVIIDGNRPKWSLIRSVIIRVITKSDDRAAGVRFVYREYAQTKLDDTKSYYQLIIKITITEKRRIAQS